MPTRKPVGPEIKVARGVNNSHIDKVLDVTHADVDDNGDFETSVHQIRQGVTPSWLAQAFKMDQKTVKNRLADCPPMRRGKGTDVYDLRQAASFLIEPKLSNDDFLRQAKEDDLPLKLQKDFWAAQNARLRYERAAGDLWDTEDVITLFSDMFRRMRDSMKLWVDTVSNSSETTEKQRKILESCVDDLQKDLYDLVLESQNISRTPSRLGKFLEQERKENEKFAGTDDWDDGDLI